MAGQSRRGMASQVGRMKKNAQVPLSLCGNRGEEISTGGRVDWV